MAVLPGPLVDIKTSLRWCLYSQSREPKQLTQQNNFYNIFFQPHHPSKILQP